MCCHGNLVKIIVLVSARKTTKSNANVSVFSIYIVNNKMSTINYMGMLQVSDTYIVYESIKFNSHNITYK